MKERSKMFNYAGILALVLMLISPVFAQNIQVQLDGSPLSFGNVPPTNLNGHVLVPLRGVFEALGAQVDYQASTRTVLAAKGNTNLRLQIGSTTAYVNENPVVLEVPAQVILGSTLVPLRFVSEALGAQVSWNPATKTISITSPQNTTPPPSNPPAGNNVPRIESVQQNAVAPLNAGATVKITVRGTPGLQGTFDVSQDITNLPLHEKNAGVYTGNYKVRPGDDVYQGYITAHLAAQNGYTISRQSQEPFTIDTKAPLIVSTRPNDGDTVDVAQPNIIIYTDDQGGSGLAPTTITLHNNGKTYEVQTTIAPPQSIRAVVPNELTGLVEVDADVTDQAGNVTKEHFSFTIQANTGSIKSVHHNAARALTAGDALTVDMTAPTGGRASFDLVEQDKPSHIIVQGIPMVEIEARHYRGTYNVFGTRDAGTLAVVGRFVDKKGDLSTKNATTPVEIVSNREAGAPMIDNPTDGDAVETPLIIRGSADARSIVQVNITATGTQYYILPYQQDLGTFKVEVNDKGKWHTDPINLPHPKNVNSLKYTITAAQENSSGRTSQSTTITVKAK